MRFIFITLSVLLIVFFFAPWINLQYYLGLQMSGATIGPDLNKLEPIKPYLRVDDLSFLKISYLLYIIPLFAVIHIFSNLLNKKGWYLRLDYFFSLLSLFVMHRIVFYLNVQEGVNYLTWGFYACMVVSITGLALQAMFYISKKRSET
jgi:hypothetical protein